MSTARVKWLVCILFGISIANTYAGQSVVMIIVDDLRPTLGAYGDKVAQTPNIDALARSSIVFNQAFAVVPVCGASRAAMLGGLKPTTQRFLTFNSRLDEDVPDAVSLPDYFRQNGYVTRGVGKVFDVSDDSSGAWSAGLWNPEGRWHSPVPRVERHEDLQKAYITPLTDKLGPATERLAVDDSAYPDGAIAAEAVRSLVRMNQGQQPFFLAVGLRKPHLPFTAPEKYWALYEREQFELARTFANSAGFPFLGLHNSGELRRQYAGIPPQGLLPDLQAQELKHGYYAAVSYIDALVGKIIAAVQALEAAPVVLLVSDHGWNLGEHTLWTKHSLFDVTLRIPMLLQIPGENPAVRKGLADTLDIFPTLVAAAGLPPVEKLDGVNQLAVMTGKEMSFARWIDGESVRTARYRYTEWHSEQDDLQAKALYDLEIDPDETRNVVDEDRYVEVVRALSSAIKENGTNLAWAPYLRQLVEYRAR